MDIPTALRTGETIWMDHEFIKMLHEGEPTVGWIGDPRLMPYYGDNRIVLMRADDRGNMKMVARSPVGVKHLGMETIVWLAEHDPQSRRGYDVYEDIKENNERARRSLDSKKADSRGEAVERLAHALLKDAGAYEGGSTRHSFSLPEAPWKKGKK